MSSTLSQPAAIVAAVKCPSARREAISRPYLSLINDTLAELEIRLQVEDIDRGLLLFWQRQEDFDQSVRFMAGFGGRLGGSSWDSGAVLWRLTMLKPTTQPELRGVLEACRTSIIGLFGSPCNLEINGIALTFLAPAAIKFLDALRLLFLDTTATPILSMANEK